MAHLRLTRKAGKRAQTEILGLAIVVIIIILGVVLSLRFIKPNQTQDLKDTFTDSTLASNMLNVMLKTTIECKDLELKTLLQDCAEGVSNKEYCEGYTDPCVYSKKIITDLLEGTIGSMKRDYLFETDSPTGGASSFSISAEDKASCTSENVGPGEDYSTRISESYPLPTKKGTMDIILSLCRK